MADLIVLDGIELVPVVELEPSVFATQSRAAPAGTFRDAPEEWQRYWSESLADSGIHGLRSLRLGSWHVPTAAFDGGSNLQRFLEKTLQEWGGVNSLSDPDARPVLDGGLALHCPAKEVLIEPGCCADLTNSSNWKIAAGFRGAHWQMLWIGHPWLSVRYQAPWLVLSERHESNAPIERWAVFPEELARAADDALAKLERFACKIAALLPNLGYRDDPRIMGRVLAGLEPLTS